MSKATLFAAAAAGGSIAALCFCWTAGFLRKKTPSSPNLSSSSHVHGAGATSKAGLSLVQEPAPEPTSPLVEANVAEILVELETHEGYQAELKSEEASDFAVVEVSLESFDCAGESQAEEEVVVVQEIEVEDPETELKAEEASVIAVVDFSHESFDGAEESETEQEEEMVVQDAIEEGQEGAKVGELVKVSGQEECLDGGRDPEAEEEDAGDEGEEVVEGGKLVEVSVRDCRVGGVDSEDEQVFLSEAGGGEAVKGGEPDGVPYQDTSLVEWGDSEVAKGDNIEGCEDVVNESVDSGDRYLANGDEGGEYQDEVFKEEVHHEQVKEHLKSNELEVPIEGPASEANLVVEVVNRTIFYMDPITKNNQGFSLLQFTTLDEAKQGLSMPKNSLVNDTPYRVAPNHAEASLVEVINQTIFYTDPITKKNNGFSLLQFGTLDKAERGVSVFTNQLGNGTPCGPTPKQDREPEEESMMDVSDRGRRFPPPDQIHDLKHPRASRHATQRGSGIPNGGFRRGSQQRTQTPGRRKMKQMCVAKLRGGTAFTA